MSMTIEEFFKEYAAVAVCNGKSYFHIPFWFELDNKGNLRSFTYEKMPEELKKGIEQIRSGNVNYVSKQNILPICDAFKIETKDGMRQGEHAISKNKREDKQ